MGKVIGLISIKGGVGKTTLSAALASDLSYNLGKRVLLIDANYSAPNLGLHMGILSNERTIHDVLKGDKLSSAIHNRYGVHVIPGHFFYKNEVNYMKLKTRLENIKRFYDFVILDSSPSLNDEMLSTIVASDQLFVVSTADLPTLSCTLKAAKIARQRGTPIAGIILNKVRGKHELSLGEIQETAGIPVVANIRDDEVVHIGLDERVPAPLFAKDSKFSREVRKLSNSLIGVRDNGSFFRRMFGLDMKKEEINRNFMRESFYRSVFE